MTTLTKQIALDSSLNELSIDLLHILTVQISCAESPLASFLFVFNLYGESLVLRNGFYLRPRRWIGSYIT